MYNYGTTAGTKYIRLTADIELSAYLKIGQNSVSQTVTIDMNGRTLRRTGLTKADANGHVIEVFGAGIWSDGTLNMQGFNTIKGNSRPAGLTTNVYLMKGRVVGVTGDLGSSSIGIGGQDDNATVTSGYAAHNTNNKLYYPTREGFTINACRGYFQLKNGLTAGDKAQGVRAFVLRFGDDSLVQDSTPDNENATGITDRNDGKVNRSCRDAGWYTLDGRLLNGKPTRSGLYFHQGNKVIIKKQGGQ